MKKNCVLCGLKLFLAFRVACIIPAWYSIARRCHTKKISRSATTIDGCRMNLIAFAFSFLLILAGCELFTNGVEWVGRRFRLSEGAIGSVLAAIGTGLPETIVPLIAILVVGGTSGEEIGMGAILGSSLTLATLALFLCGAAVFLFARRRGSSRLRIDARLLPRDISMFLLTYSLVIIAALMPPDYGWVKAGIGLLLIPLYIGFTARSLKAGENKSESEGLKNLYISGMSGKFRGRQGKVAEPGTAIIFLQVVFSLAVIIFAARLFVGEIKDISTMLGISPLILALLVSPMATELPEMFNSVLWIREKKDTYALGNITGAMVFQSCIPVTILIWLTGWHLDVTSPEGLLLAAAMGFTFVSALGLLVSSRQKEIGVPRLLILGILYLVLIVIAIMYT